MAKTNSSTNELVRELRKLHILYFLSAGLSTIVLFALAYLGAYFTDGMLKEAILYTGGIMFLSYSAYCVDRHVKIWISSRGAKLMRSSEEQVDVVKNGLAL